MAKPTSKANAQSPITEELFGFLYELQRNNDREWFAENKQRYESEVREPTLRLIEGMVKPLAKAAPMLSAVPKRTGGSLMRIYRDTRFSKDKTPYKTNVGISLRHQADKNIHAPGGYMHMACNACLIAAGVWRPERTVLAAIRKAIDRDPKKWKRVLANKKFKESFHLGGESLKTAPRDYPKDHPMIEDLRRIDFIAVCPLSEKDLTEDDPIPMLMDKIKAAKPLMKFICDAIDIPY